MRAESREFQLVSISNYFLIQLFIILLLPQVVIKQQQQQSWIHQRWVQYCLDSFTCEGFKLIDDLHWQRRRNTRRAGWLSKLNTTLLHYTSKKWLIGHRKVNSSSLTGHCSMSGTVRVGTIDDWYSNKSAEIRTISFSMSALRQQKENNTRYNNQILLKPVQLKIISRCTWKKYDQVYQLSVGVAIPLVNTFACISD